MNQVIVYYRTVTDRKKPEDKAEESKKDGQ